MKETTEINTSQEEARATVDKLRGMPGVLAARVIDEETVGVIYK